MDVILSEHQLQTPFSGVQGGLVLSLGHLDRAGTLISWLFISLFCKRGVITDSTIKYLSTRAASLSNFFVAYRFFCFLKENMLV